MQRVIKTDFADIDPDIQKARKQVALLRDELIAKEESSLSQRCCLACLGSLHLRALTMHVHETAVGERMRAGLNLTDEPFDRVPEDEADLPAHKPLLERLLRDAAGAAVEDRPVDAALAATLRARVRTSASRPPAPRRKKFAVKRR